MFPLALLRHRTLLSLSLIFILDVTMSSTADMLNTASRWLNYTVAIPMIILGTIGAAMTIVVFTAQRSFRRNPTVTYLLATAIMTAFHLPTIYSQSILVDGFGLGVFNSNDIACQEHNYLLYVTTVSAVSFPCWAAFDQYATTCREASFRQRWSSMRVVRSAIVGTVLFWSIVYIPVILFSNVVNGACILSHASYRKFMNFGLTPLVYTVLPFVLIVFFTQGTIRNLRASTLANRHDRLMKQIRRMMIPQLAILGISGFPFSIEAIYLESTSHLEKDAVRKSVEHLVVQVDRLFYHCNFVCTFYIYLYMSSDVRRVLKRTLCKCLGKNLVVPGQSSIDNSMTLQTMNS